jgi:hypothetical protein
MKNFSLICLVVMLFSISVGMANAAAYDVSTTNAYRITGESTIYQVKFEWGFSGRDVLIPVFATRGLGVADAKDTLGFELLTENGLRTDKGLSAAIVLTDAPIENGYYRLKSGETKTFTVLGVYQHERNTGKYAFVVSALPFVIEKGDSKVNTTLNTRELSEFVTEAI